MQAELSQLKKEIDPYNDQILSTRKTRFPKPNFTLLDRNYHYRKNRLLSSTNSTLRQANTTLSLQLSTTTQASA
jgi:hypothetical protein